MTKFKIVYISASPADAPALENDAEFKTLKDALIKGEHRSLFEQNPEYVPKTGTNDLSDIFRTENTKLILHFSAHGNAMGSLLLENEQGNSTVIKPAHLANYLQTHKTDISGVLFSACDSDELAEETARKLNTFAIGFRNPVTIKAAKHFTYDFYINLLKNGNIHNAFLSAKSSSELNGSKHQAKLFGIEKGQTLFDKQNITSPQEIYQTIKALFDKLEEGLIQKIINELSIQGDNNIVLQDIKDGNITINQTLALKDKLFDAYTAKNQNRHHNFPHKPQVFFGRDEKLKELHQKLSENTTLLLVNGLGGIGKTTIAQKYVNMPEYATDYDRIFWFTVIAGMQADYTREMQTALHLPPEKLKEKTPNEILQIVKNEMDNIAGNNLLIIDNANNSSELTHMQEYLPARNWKTLITSRAEPDHIPKLKIDELSPEDAKKLFLEFYTDKDLPTSAGLGNVHEPDLPTSAGLGNVYSEDLPTSAELGNVLPEDNIFLDKLLKHIGYHTLLTELLAKAGKNNMLEIEEIYQAIISADGYKHDDLQQEINPGINAYMKNTEKEVKLKEYISTLYKPKKLPPEQQQLLIYFAVLPSIDTYIKLLDELFISKPKKSNIFDYFRKLFKIKSSKDTLFFENKNILHEHLNKLHKNGYIAREKQNYRIHQLIQSIITDQLQPTPETILPLIQNLIDILDTDAYANRLDFAKYLPYAESIIGFAQSKGFTQSEALPDKSKSKTTEKLATLINNAALIFKALGETNKALEYDKKAIEIREQVLPENHPHLATSYNNVAETYRATGDTNKALEYHKKAMKILEQVLPENHPHLANSYNNVALTYKALGESNKALEYHKKAIEIREQVLPENHPSLATSFNNMAATYYALGETHKALEYHKKAMKIVEQVLPENHPHLASSYNNVAETYRDLGETNKALEYHKKALKIREQVLPENHPDLAESYNDVAVTYETLGETNKALEFGLKALNIEKEILPENHPQLASSYNNRALTYEDLGQTHKALEYHKKALKIWEKVLPENHPSLATSYNNVAATYYKLKNYQQAKQYIDRAVVIREKALPAGHPDIKNAKEWQKDIENALNSDG